MSSPLSAREGLRSDQPNDKQQCHNFDPVEDSITTFCLPILPLSEALGGHECLKMHPPEIDNTSFSATLQNLHTEAQKAIYHRAPPVRHARESFY